MKKKMIMFTFALLALVSTISVKATSYGYDVQRNDKTTSGYTYATNDSCSIKTTSYYTSDGSSITRLYPDYGSKDPVTGYATTKRNLPSGGRYFTRIDGEHTVGKNVYYSSDYR